VNVGSSTNAAIGFIYANGGTGGDSNVTGGAGGGGGGGSVQIFSGGTVNVYNTNGSGASQANQGSGGTNAVPAGGAVGGPGRSWVASVGYNGAGFYAPSEQAPVVPNNNTVEFSGAAQSVITTSIDLVSTLATIDSVTTTPSSNDFQVELRGSADNFQSDDTGWTANYVQVANKRYVKMKVIITTSTPAAPTMIDQVSLQFTRGERRDFDFKSTGCGLANGASPPTPPWGLLGLLAILTGLPLIAVLTLRARAASSAPPV
jgi:hypothetical protein